MVKKRAANIIVEQLVQENVRYIFGVTGKAISPFIDAILDYDKIEFISAKHESGAALMAFGYAQGSGKIGVCCGTTGGGSTNLATGVATAYMNSIPLLVITGQVSTFEFGKGAFQESTGYGQSINSVELFKSIAKESFAIENSSNFADTIKNAIKIATSGRKGPVHISIPFDTQIAEIEYRPSDLRKKPGAETEPVDMVKIKQAIEMIEESNKPVFLIGWGGVLSGANQKIIEIAEKLRIPVATTIQGKGAIPTNHPLCVGVLGICGHPTASDYVFDTADLLIAVGTTFGEFSTFNWDDRIIRNKKIIQIDIDYREIGKNYSVNLGITGDAKNVFTLLNQQVDVRGSLPKPDNSRFIEGEKVSGKYINPQLMEDLSIPIKPQRLMKEIRENTPDNTIFLADSGAHWAWAMHYLSVYPGGGFYPTLGLGSMGASICSAIGVQMAKPGQPVVCICGDGSFLMFGNEIATAEQFNIPVIWIILNDSKYSLPELSLKKMFNRTIGVKLNEVNFMKFAEVFNIKGYRVEKPGELTTVLSEAIASKKPVVIDVVIDQNEMPPVGRRKLK